MGALTNDVHLVADQIGGVEAFKARHLSRYVIPQSRPFEARMSYLPAKAPRILQILCKMRAIEQHLLRYATANDAGASHAVLFRHANLRAMGGGDTGCANAARPCADDEEIVIKLVRYFPASTGGGASQ